MHNISRRSFISYSGGMFALSFADVESLYKKKGLLAFSTLGCPDWSLEQILDFAVTHEYKGIEIRGIQRQLDLSKSPHFNSEIAIGETRRKLKDRGVKIVGLGSSAAMHHSAGPDREKAFDEARRFIDIASKVGCPYIRVFPDKIPKDRDNKEVLQTISESLANLANHANGSNVSVLMETHGDLVHADDIVAVMNGLGNTKNAGLVWDISNMWSVTKEPVETVYAKLKKWIRHTHLKDLVQEGGKDKYTLLGKGEVPVFAAVDLLLKNGYKGYFSFEWEKLWHPEIDEPEVAFSQFATAMTGHFAKK